MSLEEENGQVLNLIQAMLGAISPNFRAVSLVLEKSIVLNFFLEHDDPVDREEIEDIEFEFEALQNGPIDVETKIIVTGDSFATLKIPGRRIYMRREGIEG